MGLKVGDKVKVNFTGTIEEHRSGDPLCINYVVRSDSGAAHALFHLAEGEDFEVINTAPKNWPPKTGDVWRAGKKIWFARCEAYSSDVSLYSSEVGRGGEEPPYVLKTNADLRLVYRDFSNG